MCKDYYVDKVKKQNISNVKVPGKATVKKLYLISNLML